jgi:hypothetical protein
LKIKLSDEGSANCDRYLPPYILASCYCNSFALFNWRIKSHQIKKVFTRDRWVAGNGVSIVHHIAVVHIADMYNGIFPFGIYVL